MIAETYTNRISTLIMKHLRAEITPAEQAELEAWVEASGERIVFFKEVTAGESIRKDLKEVYAIAEQGSLTFEKVITQIPGTNSAALKKPAFLRRVYREWAYRLAAAIIILAAVAYIFYSPGHKQQVVHEKKVVTDYKNDIQAGGNKATLTLANGSTVILDKAVKETLAPQGAASVQHTGNGKLIYSAIHATPADAIIYNTLSTPRGGQYQLVLSDGTSVWLNAASSIHYPAVFGGNERKVEITGEGYFEVAKDMHRPFIVSVHGVEVKVLGTQFNVNAYDEEKTIKTTLLEGSVRVTQPAFARATAGESATLKPGQQAQVSTGAIKVLNDADIEKEIAWKNGMFVFEQDDIQTVMRQLSRWYNVDIAYEGQPTARLHATIPRNTPVSTVFKALESTDRVHFKIEGKKIIVTQ